MKQPGSLRATPRHASQVHTAGFFVPLLLLLGLCLGLKDWFPSLSAPWWLLFGGTALCVLLLSAARRCWLYLLALAAVAGFCAVFFREVLSGLAALANDLLARLTAFTGRILLPLALGEAENAVWGAVPLLALATLLIHLSSRTGRLLFLLPLLLSLSAALLTGFFSAGAGLVLLGLGTVLLLVRRSGGVPSWLAPVALCAALSLALCLLLPAQEGRRDSLADRIHALRYDAQTNAMPEGELQNLPAFQKSDTPALRLTLSQPQKLYLRGAVYEIYDGQRWSALSAQERADAADLFYWLHESGFYGQSQLAAASTLVTQEPVQTMTLENLSACRAHGYLPYAFVQTQALDAALIGDAALPQSGSVSYLSGSLPQWYRVQQALASAQGRSNVADYLACEAAYAEYVSQNDLQLTQESWAVLSRRLGEDETPRTLSEIRTLIRDYLEESLVYDEEISTLNGNIDFLQYTLERSGSGYSVHYATAATLMLRYFGVPARYVEGYFLSADEAQRYAAGEEILLSEAHAHAWAEYYLPGVGFVPFEVTPGYLDDEEDELGGSLIAGDQTYTADHLKYAQVEQPEKVEEAQQPRFSFSVTPLWWLWLVLLALAALALRLLLRRLRLARALAAIDRAGNREAIALRYGYAAALLRACPGAERAGQEAAEALKQEALFSNHPMSAQQRQAMDAYAASVLAACRRRWRFSQKLRYRLWDCLY